MKRFYGLSHPTLRSLLDQEYIKLNITLSDPIVHQVILFRRLVKEINSTKRFYINDLNNTKRF